MGQKVNPHGLRVGVIKNWSSRWFVKDEVFGDTLVSDYNIISLQNHRFRSWRTFCLTSMEMCWR